MTELEAPSAAPKRDLVLEFTDAGMNDIAARILAVSLRLFALKGYAATSVREIVQEADVTNPMLYYYFESKEGVFTELIRVLFDHMAGTIADVLQRHSSLDAQLRGVAQAHFEACRANPEILRFIYSVLFGPVQSRPELSVACTLEKHENPVRAAITRAIEHGEFSPRPGFDATFLTERFLGLINEHLMGVLTAYECADVPEDSPEFDALLDGFLGEAALDRMLDFYFSGAGQLSQESK